MAGSGTWARLPGRRKLKTQKEVTKGSDLVPNAGPGTAHSQGLLTFLPGLFALRCNVPVPDPWGGPGLARRMHVWDSAWRSKWPEPGSYRSLLCDPQQPLVFPELNGIEAIIAILTHTLVSTFL